MKSNWRVLVGTLALVVAGLGLAWTVSYQPPEVTSAARLAGGMIQLGSSETPSYTVTVSGPYTPTLSIAVRDLPDEPDLPTLDREPVQRDNHGIIVPDIQMPPHGNPLAELQANAPEPIPDGFETPILNFAGIQDNSSPPDDTGDVGPNHYLQADNGPNGSRVTIYDKAGTFLYQFDMEDLASSAPCTNGYCDPIVQYDELADRWFISEFDTSVQNLCVYVSQTSDPTGSWWAYAFNPPGGMQDYPKYSVWPDGYYMAANNNGTVVVLERADMLNGQPATMQSFSIGTLPGFSFQLTMPATLEGQAPPAGSPALYLRPRDTEIHGGDCPSCDLMEMWALHIDWGTPGNSTLTTLPGVQLADWDQTLCGTGSDWSCMSQPGTSQKLDPIREPLHYPLQYRNFGTHETLVGCFAEDVDGLDRAAVHWFEIRSTPPGSGNWVLYQEGVLGDGVGDIHHSVCSAAMDSAGNIAVGYTRTGANAPYYPSIYYSGRRASDPLGTMPYYDNLIWDATTSKTNNERWGDYSGIGVDPADGCTFWYTTEYGGVGNTRIAALKFDECGSSDFTLNVSPDSLDVCAPNEAVYTVSIGSVSGFTNTVTLTSTGTPVGTTTSFVPNPVDPPGESLFTVGNTAGATPGTYNITIGGTAQGSSGHQDTVVLNLLGAELELLPAAEAQSGEPGTIVTYTLSVENTGGCVDSFDVSLSGNTWSVSAPLEIGPLVGGGSAFFDVTVEIPPEANNGDVDQVSVTLTSQRDPSMTDSSLLTTSAFVPCTDLTSITIAGSSLGTPGIYTFTTSYEPLDATLPIAYLWDNGDTTTDTVRTLDEGSYTLVVTATNCIHTEVIGSHDIQIGVPPEVTFASNTPVTVGESAVFTPTVTGTGSFEFLWDFGDSLTSTLESPTHLYAAADTYTVTLTVTSDWGTDVYIAEFVVNPEEPPVILTFLALVVK